MATPYRQWLPTKTDALHRYLLSNNGLDIADSQQLGPTTLPPAPSLFINISGETIGTVSISDNVLHNCGFQTAFQVSGPCRPDTNGPNKYTTT